MKIVKFLLIVVILLIVLLAGLVAALYFADLNQYKGPLEQQIAKVTGREFRIDGDSELEISLQPRILLRDVHMKNAAWGSEVEILKVGEAELQIALMPLLVNRIEVLKLSLSELDIALENNDEGKSNWDMSSGEAKTETAADKGSGGITMEIALHEVLVKNARIIYKEGPGKQATRLNLDKLTGGRLDNGFDQWNLAAKINDIPVAIQGTTSSLHKLLGGQPFENHLVGNLGNIEFTLDGSMTLNDGLGGIDMKTTLKAPDLKTAAELTQAELPAVGPIVMSAKLSEIDKSYKIDLSGNLADIKLMLKGLVGKALDGKGMKVEYAIEAPNLKTASTIAGTELPDVGPIKASGTASDSKEFYRMTLNGAVADLKIDADGRIAQSLDGKGLEMSLALQAPDLQQIGRLGGAGLPPAGPVDVKAKVNDIEGGYKISGLTAKIGESDLNGDASIIYQSKPVAIKATLNSTRLDLTPFQKQESGTKPAPAATSEARQTKSAPAAKKGSKPKTSKTTEASSYERVFPATPLPFDQLKMVNAEVKYDAKVLETEERTLRDVNLALKLDSGRLELKPVQAQLESGSIEGDAVLDASKSETQAAIALNLQARDLILGDFKQLKETMSGGSTKIDVHLQGAGNSVREIMAGLNGKTVVDVGQATLSSDTINLIGGDIFLKLLGALTPKQDKSTTARLDCAVVKFDIKDGIAATNDGIVVKTERTILVGRGNIDLKTEQISLKIAARSRSLNVVDTGDLTRVVGLGGTLANPAPVVNIEGVAKTGATIGAAVLTLGASYIAQNMINSALKDKNPCLTALNKAPQADGETPEGEKKDKTAPKAETVLKGEVAAEDKTAPKSKAVPKNEAAAKDEAKQKKEKAEPSIKWNESSLPVQ